MTDRVKELSKIAMDYAAEQYGPQRAGEKVWDPLTYDRKFAELIVLECVELGDKALQDGKWPGDVLKEHFGIQNTTTANILAGADNMSDKGYRIGTQEGYDAFVSKRNGR